MPGDVQVAAGVLVRDDTILACQRARSSLHGGKWEFPGGKLEPGETLSECLRRELEEELAIKARIGRQLWVTHFAYPGRRPVVITFFRVDQYDGAVTNRIFEAIRWLPVEQLGQVDFLEADREFVDHLMSGAIDL